MKSYRRRAVRYLVLHYYCEPQISLTVTNIIQRIQECRPTFIYRTSTLPSAHDNSLTEKCSLHASHILAPHTRCQSLAQPHPHVSSCQSPPSARRAASSSEWLQHRYGTQLCFIFRMTRSFSSADNTRTTVISHTYKIAWENKGPSNLVQRTSKRRVCSAVQAVMGRPQNLRSVALRQAQQKFIVRVHALKVSFPQ